MRFLDCLLAVLFSAVLAGGTAGVEAMSKSFLSWGRGGVRRIFAPLFGGKHSCFSCPV